MGYDLDPFGRKKDENPLASLGWEGDETAATAAEPAPEREREPAAVFETAPEPSDQPRTPPRWPSPTPSRPPALAAGTRPHPAHGARPAPAGRAARQGGDRPRRADRRPRRIIGTRVTMSRLRTGGYDRLVSLRVAPVRIDATLVTKDGRLRQVQIVPGGAVRVVGTTPAGFAGTPTMALTGIVAAAPSRLTRAAAGRLRQPASRVNYLVLSEFAGARQWNVYFKGGQSFSADARGRITRRNS